MKKTIKISLNRQQLDDLLSALSFFISDYENHTEQPCPVTILAMEKLNKKLWNAIDKLKEGKE